MFFFLDSILLFRKKLFLKKDLKPSVPINGKIHNLLWYTVADILGKQAQKIF